jgi:hypothetical protein
MAESTPSSSPAPSMPPSAAASTAIPFRSDPDLRGDGVGLPAAALACLLVLAAAIVILRRWGPSGTALPARRQRAVQVIESVRLADRTRVSVLRYRDRELLVAHSEHAIAVLSDEAATPAGGGAA